MTMEMMIGLVIFCIWIFIAIHYLLGGIARGMMGGKKFNIFEWMLVSPVMVPLYIVRFIFGKK